MIKSDPSSSDAPETRRGAAHSASDEDGPGTNAMHHTQADVTPRRSTAVSPENLAPFFPQYEIQRILGCGGMGAVYLARQISLNRLVAIKVLPADLGQDAELDFCERFRNEAQAMAQLSHPGIVAVHDFGQTSNGLLYIVMEYIEGTDVQQMVAQQGRLHSAHAMAVTAHVCDALAYAHSRGIIHRDIKPSNIMVSNDGVVKVADFGLAKMSQEGRTGITQSGVTMGTLHFMAPEALTLGAAVDQRADIYAVGVMLYQMLTGKLPQGLFEMPSLQVPGLDPRYDGIIAKALREDRAVRYQQASELRHDLDAILTQPVMKVEPSEEDAPVAAVPPPGSEPQRASSQPPQPLEPQVVVSTRRRGAPLLWLVLVVLGSAAVWMSWQRSGDDNATTLVPSPSNSRASFPPLAPADGWTNLLSAVDVKRDSIMAPWTMGNGVLRSPQNNDDKNDAGVHQTLVFPVRSSPHTFDLRYVITRNQKGAGIVMGFVRDGKPGHLIVDGGGGYRLNARGKERQGREWFPVGETHEVLIEVREASVRVRHDGEVQLEHSGDLEEARVDEHFFPPPKITGPVFRISVCRGDITVHSAEFRQIDKDGKPVLVPIASAPTTAKAPLASAAVTQTAGGKTDKPQGETRPADLALYVGRWTHTKRRVNRSAEMVIEEDLTARRIAPGSLGVQKAGTWSVTDGVFVVKWADRTRWVGKLSADGKSLNNIENTDGDEDGAAPWVRTK